MVRVDRIRRFGRPAKTGKRVVDQNQEVKVSPQDRDLIEAGYSITNFRYALLSAKVNKVQSRTLMHRIILQRILGRDLRKGEVADHINHDTLDNRRENLRAVTHLENSQNIGKCYSRSGYFGVWRHSKAPKWMAGIKANGIRYYLGLHECPKMAAMAYDRKAKELGVLTRNFK